VKDWTDWEIRRHQVAIGGRVVDDRDQPVARAQVTITAMPTALRQKIDDAASAAGAGWQDLDERVDRTLTKADGSFYFLDLPGGRYTLRGIVLGSDLQAQRTVSVSWGQDGNVKKAIADLKLSKARRGRS
jgi:Carboxypeptidase regulatory-like domain